MRTRLFRSESFRQAAIYAGLFAIAMSVLFAAMFFILDHSFKSNLMREVADDLASIRAAYVLDHDENIDHEAQEIVEGRLREPDADDAFLLQRNGKRLAGNIPAMPVRLGEFTLILPTRDPDGAHTILGRGEMVVPGVYAFVGRDLEQVRAAEKGIRYAFGVVLLASLVLAGLSALALSRSFLSRVDAVTETCRSIMAGRLGERIPLSGPDGEFKRLGAAINATLDRIQMLMESLRQVSNDIAHDMRTPLTHLRQKLERARDESTTLAEYAGAVDGAIADCDKLLTVFTALLRIAQIEAGAKRSEFAVVDLQELAVKAGEIYAPVMEDMGHGFSTQLAAVPALKGDRQLLLQLIANLLDNAITHTPSGCTVVLSCVEVAGQAVLTVGDNGPGIPAGERDKVLRRFYRGEQSRTTPGSGLGLSLVVAVAELHGAELALADNAPGLRVSVRFPGV